MDQPRQRLAALSLAIVVSVAVVLPAAASTVASAASPASGTVGASISQEWAAVQVVVGPTINPQAFLYNATHATGQQALVFASMLQMSPSLFLMFQGHPAYLMARIQTWIQPFYRQGVFIVETVNQNIGDMLNFYGLTPQEEAALITRVATMPPATRFLPASPPAVSGPGRGLPAISYFHLPVSVGGVLAGNPREGTGCEAPCPPLADYKPGPPPIYDYQVAPPLATQGFVNGTYRVSIYPSVAAARSANLATENNQLDQWLGGEGVPALPIAAPVAANEWLRGAPLPHFNGNKYPDCYALGGVRFDNVLMVAVVDDFGAITPPGYATCQTSYKWVTRVLAALYVRAERVGHP